MSERFIGRKWCDMRKNTLSSSEHESHWGRNWHKQEQCTSSLLFCYSDFKKLISRKGNVSHLDDWSPLLFSYTSLQEEVILMCSRCFPHGSQLVSIFTHVYTSMLFKNIPFSSLKFLCTPWQHYFLIAVHIVYRIF